jgi:DNA polymerase-1
MLDFMEGISETIDMKKDVNKKISFDPLLYKKGTTPTYTFILDKLISKDQVKLLSKIIDNRLGQIDYQILFGLTVDLDDDEKGAIWRNYATFAIDYKSYIPEWSKIISFGSILFSITKSNDLDGSKIKDDEEKEDKKKVSIIQGFYDTLTKHTYFFDPITKCYVFPVDSWTTLFKTGRAERSSFRDCFEYWFMKEQFSNAKKLKVEKTKIKECKKVMVDSPNDFLSEYIGKEMTIGLDLETELTDPWHKDGFVICMTLSFDGKTGYYLRWPDIDLKMLTEFLKGKKLVGTNIKFDAKWLVLHGKVPVRDIQIIGDTMNLQHVFNELQRKGLKAGAWLYTMLGGYDKELDTYIEKHKECKGHYSKIPEDVLFPYACIDPCMSLTIHNILIEKIRELDSLYCKKIKEKFGYGLEWAYNNIIVPAINMYTEAELNGMGINIEKLREQGQLLKQEIWTLENEILLELGETRDTLNLSSGEQLGKKIATLGWKIRRKAEKGYPNVDHEALDRWVKEGHPLAKQILILKEKQKLFSTYIGDEKEGSGKWEHIKSDNKIHSTYAVMLAKSWRGKSYNPNLQNEPSRGKKAEIARSTYTPLNDPNYVFLTGDYSGLQLRLACIESKDEVMIKAFLHEGGDLHLLTAYNVFLKRKMTFEEAKAKLKAGDNEVIYYRKKSKGINFGLLFGASAFTVATKSIAPEWTIEECKDYIKENNLNHIVEKLYEDLTNKGKNASKFDAVDNMNQCYYWAVATDIREKFFETYKGLEKWIKGTQDVACSRGYTQNYYGTIRRLPYLLYKGMEDDKSRFANYKNIAVNSPIQGEESVIVNRWLINILNYIKENNLKSKILGQIHDAGEKAIHKENFDIIPKVKEFGELDYPEYDGIPLEIEMNLADYYGHGELWDMGCSVEVIDNEVFITRKKEKLKIA